jgi:isoleucyl-tRNA synthetase
MILDIVQDEAMRQEGVAREVMNRVQKLRKKAGIHPSDPIEVFYKVDQATEVGKVIQKMGDFISKTTNVGLAPLDQLPQLSVQIIAEETSVRWRSVCNDCSLGCGSQVILNHSPACFWN